MIKVYADAAVAGNPGTAAIGVIIYKNKQQYVLTHVLEEPLNNHEAEYESILYALNYLIEQEWQNELLFLYSDSQVIVQAINRKSAKALWQQEKLQRVIELLEQFQTYFVEWYSDKDNPAADLAAKRALYQAKKNT